MHANLANTVLFGTMVGALLLCSCSWDRTVPAGHDAITPQPAAKAFHGNEAEFQAMVGKHVQLSGILVNAGKGNYALQTINGLVELDGTLEINETKEGSNVVVDGTLEFQEAVTIPKDLDPLAIQTRYHPGQEIPQHYILRHPKIVAERGGKLVQRGFR